MGSCSSRRISKHFVVNHSVPGQTETVLTLCDTLGINNHDLDQLWRAFQKYNAHGSGQISLDEFIIGCQLEICEAFAKLVFRLFDVDGSGAISFKEFLISCWALCSCDTKSLAIYSFSLFDVDASGEMDGSEIEFMASLMHDFKPLSNVQKALQHLNTLRVESETETITLNQYLEEVHRAEVLLMPATEMQLLVMKTTLGTTGWNKHQELRKERFKDQTIFDILGLKHQEAALMKARGLSKIKPPQHQQVSSIVQNKLEKARTLAQAERAKRANKAQADNYNDPDVYAARHANDVQRTILNGHAPGHAPAGQDHHERPRRPSLSGGPPAPAPHGHAHGHGHGHHDQHHHDKAHKAASDGHHTGAGATAAHGPGQGHGETPHAHAHAHGHGHGHGHHNHGHGHAHAHDTQLDHQVPGEGKKKSSSHDHGHPHGTLTVKKSVVPAH